MMETFDHFVHEWGLLIIFLAVYSVMRYGKKNRMKYKRWDKIRAQQQKRKWRLKKQNPPSRRWKLH